MAATLFFLSPRFFLAAKEPFAGGAAAAVEAELLMLPSLPGPKGVNEQQNEKQPYILQRDAMMTEFRHPAEVVLIVVRTCERAANREVALEAAAWESGA